MNEKLALIKQFFPGCYIVKSFRGRKVKKIKPHKSVTETEVCGLYTREIRRQIISRYNDGWTLRELSRGLHLYSVVKIIEYAAALGLCKPITLRLGDTRCFIPSKKVAI